jgi:hypothetical protein
MSLSTKWHHQRRDVERLCPTLFIYFFALIHQYQAAKAKVAVHPRPAKPDPPLKLNAPKPTFINARQNSAFGFKSKTPSDKAPDSDVDMDVQSAKERLAEAIFQNDNGETEFIYILYYYANSH